MKERERGTENKCERLLPSQHSRCGPWNYCRLLHLLFGHLCVISENVGDIMPARLARAGESEFGVARLSVLEGTYFVSRSFSPRSIVVAVAAAAVAALVVLRICLLFS